MGFGVWGLGFGVWGLGFREFWEGSSPLWQLGKENPNLSDAWDLRALGPIRAIGVAPKP